MAVFSVTVNPIGTSATVASQFENFAGAVPVTGPNGTVAINAFTTPASPFGVYALPFFFNPANTPSITPDNRVRIVGTTNGETINASLIDPAGETSFPRGNNLIFGNAGDDTIFGGAGNDFVDGGFGNDVLNGGAGADTLNGNAGNDTIDGGSGSDSIDGGDGNDTIVADLLDFIDPATNAPYTTSNPRLSGGAGFDVLVLPAGTNPATVSSAIGISIANDFERILIGTELLNQIEIIGTPNPDVLNGTAASEVLNGLGGNDVLNGGAGDDTLDGGSGADIMNGGPGNDTFIVDSPSDVVNELAGEGSGDVVRITGGGNYSAFNFNNVESIEIATPAPITLPGALAPALVVSASSVNISFDGSADVLEFVGTPGADIIVGGTGNDQLNGGAGADILTGGKGADTLIGGSGADTFIFNPGDSPASAPNIDVITDFAQGVDKIKVSAPFGPGTYGGFVALPLFVPINSINALFGNANIAAALAGPPNFVQVNVLAGTIAGSYLVFDINNDNTFTGADDIISLGGLLSNNLVAADFTN